MATHQSLQLDGDICKKSSIAQLNRKVARARARAEQEALRADEVALNENQQLVSAGVKRSTIVSARMSSKGFATKDPRLALKILRCMHVDAMKQYTFDMLGITSHKYHVSSLCEKLVDSSMYPTIRSAAMPATQALRYLYEVAMESGDETTRNLLCWHTAQQLLQGRASRGTGVVAANDDAKALLATALAACVKRVEKRVETDEQYVRAMSATADACC